MSRSYYHRHHKQPRTWQPYWRNLEDRSLRYQAKLLLAKGTYEDLEVADYMLPSRPRMPFFF